MKTKGIVNLHWEGEALAPMEGTIMTERRFFIPDTAKDIFEIENSSRFYCVGDFEGGKIYHDALSENHDFEGGKIYHDALSENHDFEGGKIYHDALSENHDLYYVGHSLMSANEMEKYLENKMN